MAGELGALPMRDFRLDTTYFRERKSYGSASTLITRCSFMWLLLAILLILAWGGSFFLFHVTGFLIHILIVFAVISLILHLVGGRRA
jgi:hypothetical protein